MTSIAAQSKVTSSRHRNLLVIGVVHRYNVAVLREMARLGCSTRVILRAQRPGFHTDEVEAYAKETDAILEELDNYQLPEEFERVFDPDYSYLDLEFFERSAYLEKMFVMSLDRLAFWPPSQVQAHRWFHQMVAHFNKIVGRCEIDAIVTFGLPHGLSSIALLALARAKEITVVFTEGAGLSANTMAVIETEVAQRRKLPEFRPRAEVPAAAQSRFREDMLAPAVWAGSKPPDRVRQAAAFIAGSLVKPFEQYLGHSGFFMTTRPRRRVSYVLPIVRYLLRGLRLRRFYERHALPRPTASNYIAFFLHMQPEATTVPNAGIFADQLLAFELLREALPEGTALYVKEHPFQWSRFIEDNHERSPGFYSRMLSDPRVALIDTGFASGELLDKAKVVVTISGTVGWEALRRGRPVIVFGHAWYRTCKSCFSVDSVSSLRDAIAKAMTRTETEVHRDVEEFLRQFSGRLVPAKGDHYGFDSPDSDFDVGSASVLAAYLSDAVHAGASDLDFDNTRVASAGSPS